MWTLKVGAFSNAGRYNYHTIKSGAFAFKKWAIAGLAEKVVEYLLIVSRFQLAEKTGKRVAPSTIAIEPVGYDHKVPGQAVRRDRAHENDRKVKAGMKVDFPPPFFNVPGPAQRTSGISVGVGFSASLQNAASATSPAQNLSQQPARLSLTHSSQSMSQHAKPQLSLNERALSLRAYRQELLASNIANADTPGYKAVDIDINEALRTGKSKDEVIVQYRTPAQGSADNNTVDMDVERAQFAQNALMYEYTVDRVKGHYKEMEELLKNTPY